MYERDGIVYADEPRGEIEVSFVKPLGDLMMLVTFTSGETRLFDASTLVDKPVFSSLTIESVFSNPVIENGVCTWSNGEIDISPAYLYHHSYAYAQIA